MKKLLLPIIALCFSMSFAQSDDDDEWADFDYQHAGLSQVEFQKVKESGMTKKKLLHLLEIGIRPKTYLQEPWNDLGVSESEWLEQRASGMEDADIDRTYKNNTGNQGAAYLSFLLPSYYQWITDDMAKAIAMNVLEASFIGLTVFLYKSDTGGENSWVLYGVPLIAINHLWSGIDALLATQWDNNPTAKSFSWGIIPTGNKSFVAGATLRF
ncbi:MAG: hypothetical protein LBC87_05485 [Fibromonadaceae bacterium]|jgi:hypothetical protein|nr:hypothetical protein [Fibromonadaceae bacterium]